MRRLTKSPGCLIGVLTGGWLAFAIPALGQQSGNVALEATSSLGTIPSTAFGVNTAVWDGTLLDAAVPGLLSQAGVNMLRFPGGSTADVYHWQTNTSTSGTGQYVNPNITFDAFMSMARQAGATPVITVNYGSNAAGTAGNDPSDAAAWVTYSNVTKGYGVKYWEIGNEIYGNGEYGNGWEEDLHSDHSPTGYGNNVVAFASQMKSADSTIKVGAVLTAPGNWPDGQTPDWNSNVLAACGSSIDFVIIHWYPQGPGSESDSGLLGVTSDIAGMVSSVRKLINQYCGSNASRVQILVTEANSVAYDPGKQTVSIVNALFLADNYMKWLENGVANVDWWDLHNGIMTGDNNSSSLYGSAQYGDYGLLSSGQSSGSISEPPLHTPFPPYYGLQMLTHLGKPGDQMVKVESNRPLIAAHAVKQSNGDLSVLVINRDPANSYSLNFGVSGYAPLSSGTVYSYGESSTAITTGTTSSAGVSFNWTVPPYSLTTLTLQPAAASTPAFASSASFTPTSAQPGQAVTIKTKVTAVGGALTGAVVTVGVYDKTGTQVGLTTYTGQNFAANQSLNYTSTWTASSIAGSYLVEIGVSGPNGSPLYAWNNNAGTIKVAGDSAQYNFESGTQGWTVSGGMLTGVATSSAQVYAGSYSLAVTFNGSGADAQQVYVSAPATPAGKTVSFHVWIPAGSQITAVQPYVQQGANGNYTWTGNYQSISSLKTGAWNTITVTTPSNAVTPLFQLGVQFFTGAAWSGTCYVDSVSW